MVKGLLKNYVIILGWRSGGGVSHWTLEHREVILNYQIWKILKMGFKVIMLKTCMVNNSHKTVSKNFGPYLRDLPLKSCKKNALTWSIFELEKCTFYQ